jgi:hypothetical protein
VTIDNLRRTVLRTNQPEFIGSRNQQLIEGTRRDDCPSLHYARLIAHLSKRIHSKGARKKR